MEIYRGTLEEFKEWHTAAKIAENIPPEGRIGFVNGVPAPNNQRTFNVADPIQNPDKSNDYYWDNEKFKDNKYPKSTINKIEDINWTKNG